jgi:hypothetical protein
MVLSDSLWNLSSDRAVTDLSVTFVLLASNQQSVSLSGLEIDRFPGDSDIVVRKLAQVLVVTNGTTRLSGSTLRRKP